MDEQTVKKVLEMLSDANLVVCDAAFIGQCHPGACDDHEYIIGRVEESGGFGTN